MAPLDTAKSILGSLTLSIAIALLISSVLLKNIFIISKDEISHEPINIDNINNITSIDDNIINDLFFIFFNSLFAQKMVLIYEAQ